MARAKRKNPNKSPVMPSPGAAGGLVPQVEIERPRNMEAQLVTIHIRTYSSYIDMDIHKSQQRI